MTNTQNPPIDDPLERIARTLADWLYTDSRVPYEESLPLIRQGIAEDGITDMTPAEAELFICGEESEMEPLARRWPRTHAKISSLF